MSIAPDTIILDKYRIVRLLGEGGMGRVWLAEEMGFGRRQVAIKEPLPAGDNSEEIQRRFTQELTIYAALEEAHAPNLVRVITVEQYAGQPLLVMEYLPGQDLAALIQQHPQGLPVERAIAIASQVLAALRVAHDHPWEIVHRDIKPANVLFDGDDGARLTDFGLAQLAGASQRSLLQGQPHPGTPAYMAPEQAGGTLALTPAADVYAVGAVLFEMLTGKRYHRQRPLIAPSKINPFVPKWLNAVVLKALARDPWQRYGSAGDLSVALAQPVVSTSGSRKYPGKIVLIAIGTIVAGILGLALLYRPPTNAILSGDRHTDNGNVTDAQSVATSTVRDSEAEETLVPVEVVSTTVPIDPASPESMTQVPPQPPLPITGEVQEIGGINFIYVPQGDSIMGSDFDQANAAHELCEQETVGEWFACDANFQESIFDDERPLHSVQLDGFWMMETELTNEHWQNFMDNGGYTTLRFWSDEGWRWKIENRRTKPACWEENTLIDAHKPVVCVAWHEVYAFANWLSEQSGREIRMPTEAEWERAARGADERIYPWGNEFHPHRVNFCCPPQPVDIRGNDNQSAAVARVGQFSGDVGPYGILDMAGNVSEWVSDWYDASYYEASPISNPRGPETGKERVIRGGSFADNSWTTRGAWRDKLSPDSSSASLGARLVAPYP